MTENLPAVPEARAMVAAPADTDSWVQVMGPIVKLAQNVADTDFVPKGLRGRPAAVTAAVLSGRELGLPPMTSLQLTHVVEGKPGLSAEGMRALVFAAGHEIEFLESTGQVCRIRGRRRGQEVWTEVIWTMDMARQAGLAGKPIYKNFPRTQLQARCTTELCRMIYPDVIHGFRSLEELEDMAEDSTPELPPGEPVRRGAAKKAPAKKAAAKAAAPSRAPATPNVDEALPPLPGEPGAEDSPAGPVAEAAGDAGAEQETEPEATSPVAGPEDAGEAAPTEDAPGTDEAGGPGEAPGSPAPSDGGSEEAGSTPASPEPTAEPDEDGAVDAEVVGEGPDPEKATGPQVRKIQMQFARLGFEGRSAEAREERLGLTGVIVGHPVDSTNALTGDEASGVIDTLARCKDRAALEAIVQGIREAEEEAGS